MSVRAAIPASPRDRIADGTPADAPAARSAAQSEFVDAALVIRGLRAASARAKTDGAAGLAEFGKAVGQLADWWPRYDVGERRAAVFQGR